MRMRATLIAWKLYCTEKFPTDVMSLDRILLRRRFCKAATEEATCPARNLRYKKKERKGGGLLLLCVCVYVYIYVCLYMYVCEEESIVCLC